MKAVILALTIAGVAATVPANAQIMGTRLPTPTTSTSRNTGVNGSWQVIGRDNNGNTIYERRTYDANGNILVQRAVRDGNGNFRVISSDTIRNGNSRDCQYTNNGSVTDVILGRTGTINNDCRDSRGRRVDGTWQQVGQGRNNNSIYQRRVVDRNGNVVIQRARRNSDGTFTILSSRTVRNDGSIGRNRGDDDEGRYNRGDDDDDDDNGRYTNSNRGSERHGHHGGKGKKGRD